MIISDKERQAPITISDAEPSHLARYRFALQFIRPTDKVLDIPCGGGYGSGLMAEKAKNVTGMDIHSGAIQHAKEFFQKPNTEFVLGDMDDLENSPIKGQTFNIIVSLEGIEHIKKQKYFLKDIKRFMNKDGYLLISTPRKPHGSPYHTMEFSLEDFTEALSEDFVIEKMFGQIYTDIFDMEARKEDPANYRRFNFIALCKLR